MITFRQYRHRRWAEMPEDVKTFWRALGFKALHAVVELWREQFEEYRRTIN